MPAKRPILVAGYGNDDRGDDAVGLEVLRVLGDRAAPGAELVDLERKPGRLLELLPDYSAVALVDAAYVQFTPPGEVLAATLEASKALTPEQPVSGHGWSLTEEIAFAQALGVLPKEAKLWVVSIDQHETGAEMTQAVRAAAQRAADQIAAWCTTLAKKEDRDAFGISDGRLVGHD